MRRTATLRVVLVGTTVALVCVAVIVVGVQAVRLLQRLADGQALARVDLAGRAGWELLRHTGEELDTTARLLTERSTLRRHLEQGDAAAQEAFLHRFSLTSGVSGCAATGPDGLVAGGDRDLPWPEIAAEGAGGEPGAEAGWFLLGGRSGAPPVLAAFHAVDGLDGVRVAAARRLDARFAAEIARRVGLPVTIKGPESAPATGPAPGREGEGASGSGPHGWSGRVESEGAYVNVQPLADRAGRIVALMETRLDTGAVDASVRELVGTLVLGTLAVASLAALAALMLARRLVRPLEALTAATARIGRGDMGTPIPRAGGVEIGALSATMEEMRARLLRLTAELRRKGMEAEAVLTGIVEGVWTVDRERRVTWMNPQAAAMLGVRPEDVHGKFCGDILRPVLPGGGRPCEEQCPILHARFRGGARATERLALPGGGERTVVITSAPPAGADEGGEEPFQQFQVLRDETELEAARGLRDTVLANISHEFRTPLSAQLASLEILRERLRGSPDGDVEELVHSIERGTLRLTRLIDNLLESIRIEAGRDSIRRQSVQMDQVVEEAVELTSSLVRQKGQTLEVQLPWPLPAMTGDAPRLVQVFVNLLANANKFAPPGSSIIIGGQVMKEEVAIWVEDNGPGLPEEIGERLFERFQRAPGEEPVASGMGLGLWIVNSIVTRHGGRVDARNTGAGARVTIVLPCGQADEDPGR